MKRAFAEIQDEVLFESLLPSKSDRPLYVGSTFSRRRFVYVFIVCSCILGIIFFRAVWVMIVQGEQYHFFSEANRLRFVPIWPKRGIIRDRTGVILAENAVRFQIVLSPRDLPRDPQEQDEIFGEVARFLGVTMADIRSQADARFEEASILSDSLEYEQAMKFVILLPKLSGLRLEMRVKRLYPFAPELQSLSHLLGYVGKLTQEDYVSRKDQGYRRSDEIGETGVEQAYESFLRGSVGERVHEVDATGHVRAFVREVPAKDGQEVRLGIDIALQRQTEQSLHAWLEKARVARGAVVVLDPRDGTILSMVGLPGYDNNSFAGHVSSTLYQSLLQDKNQPLFPRAWAGSYPSGSTVKIVIALAALAEKLITPSTSVVSQGGIRVGAWFFPDWKEDGHGVTDVRKAIAWSVNTFFYTVGGGTASFSGLGVDRLAQWMQKFGLGQKTNFDLAGEATGFVPRKKWKEESKGEKWFIGDTYNLSIGQGDLLVTPLQVALYTAAIANRGVLLTPHILLSSSFFPRSTGLAARGFFETVRSGMRDAVKYGSARGLNYLPFPVAGKTGTAQGIEENKTHAWMTAFAPFDDPEIVVTVLLEEGGEGSSVAVPVARDVLAKWWELKKMRGGKF